MSALVTRLLSHYWTADDHPAARQAQLEDWIEDLAVFPIHVVEEACRKWRQINNRRPTPADIRKLAFDANPIQPPEFHIEYHSITDAEFEAKARNRRSLAPLWSFVRRALQGEDPDKLIEEMR